MTNDKDVCFSKKKPRHSLLLAKKLCLSAHVRAREYFLPPQASVRENGTIPPTTSSFGIRIIRSEVINLHCGAAANAKNEDLIVFQPCTCARLHRSHHNLPSRWRWRSLSMGAQLVDQESSHDSQESPAGAHDNRSRRASSALAESQTQSSPPLGFGARTVRVQAGDTLTHIAREMGVSVQELADLNRLATQGTPADGTKRSADHLQIGETLRVPPRGTRSVNDDALNSVWAKRAKRKSAFEAHRPVDEYLAHPRMTRLFKALRVVETSNMWPPPDGDGGESIGPLQISSAYHRDAWEGELADPDAIYPRLRTDLEWSQRTCLRYWQRWVPWALAVLDEEALARVHNGGPFPARPNGIAPHKTARYWRKVRGELLFGAGRRKRNASDGEQRLRDWSRATDWGHRTTLHPVPVWARLSSIGDPRWRIDQPCEARTALSVSVPLPPRWLFWRRN